MLDETTLCDRRLFSERLRAVSCGPYLLVRISNKITEDYFAPWERHRFEVNADFILQ